MYLGEKDNTTMDYDKEDIWEYMHHLSLGVISTVTMKGTPEAALVGFAQTNSFEILFGTNVATRKYENIRHQPRVAFVIGWDKGRTVQLEGTARELKKEEWSVVERYYWTKTPDAKWFATEKGQCYFIVKVEWMRYVQKPGYEVEFRL
jgi:general stress protein 26